jgi:hypothetical protein
LMMSVGLYRLMAPPTLEAVLPVTRFPEKVELVMVVGVLEKLNSAPRLNCADFV